MTTRREAIVVISLLCSVWIGLTLSAGALKAAEQRRVRIFDVTTAHGIVDQKPDRPASTFTPDDNPIFVWFRAEGCTIGTTITSVWYYVDADATIRIREGSVTIEVLGDWGQFNFELAAGKRWPTGEYRVELRVGDALLAETAFRVAESTSRTPVIASAARRPSVRTRLQPPFP